ncbi:hypothetical protein CH373_12460 [Leptospira perolatii]|uniref:Uncharacterized protein n=1 Tax=Leptospira perolatii TaxID=2023191 RepID=A0A2M9ZLK4_9LEPT|nr:hypothetical protein [Leptospira perolatii]PJZ70252.1 hypothetical protein CH360_06510 [Leptospira perolatii]PJZ72864.1 hypothetical protein CH373_12460 [Leptospira perolatii]
MWKKGRKHFRPLDNNLFTLIDLLRNHLWPLVMFYPMDVGSISYDRGRGSSATLSITGMGLTVWFFSELNEIDALLEPMNQLRDWEMYRLSKLSSLYGIGKKFVNEEQGIVNEIDFLISNVEEISKFFTSKEINKKRLNYILKEEEMYPDLLED